MKIFIVLSLVLAASALTYESNTNNINNNYPPYEGSNEWDSSPRNGNSLNGRAPSDVNGLTVENLGAIFQRQNQQYQQGQRSRDDSSLGYQASYPDSAKYDAMIRGRLSTSKAFSNKPEVRRIITQVAEDKFKQCKVLMLTDDRADACFRSAIGQIARLVSFVEYMARNPQ